MKKQVDYSKLKALAQSIIECIGDDDEGEDPKLPAQKQDINDGGQQELCKMAPAAKDFNFAEAKEDDSPSGDDEMGDEDGLEGKKKKMSLMSQMLKSKMNKYA